MSNQAQLQLVGTGSALLAEDEPGMSALDIVALASLSPPEQKRVEQTALCARAASGLLGVAVTPRAWDVRPVVVVPEDGDNELSMVRALSPEVTLSIFLSARMTDTLKRLTALPELRAEVRGWGVLEGQIWYRRAVTPLTLLDRFQSKRVLSFHEALDIAERAAALTDRWHAAEIIHGHLSPSNIGLREGGEVSLLDGGSAASVVQANAALSMNSFPRGYQSGWFAPETLEHSELAESADIFGLGLVYWELFGRVPRGENEDGALKRIDPEAHQALRNLVEAMVDRDPARRPSLESVIDSLGRRRMLGAISTGRFAVPVPSETEVEPGSPASDGEVADQIGRIDLGGETFSAGRRKSSDSESTNPASYLSETEENSPRGSSMTAVPEVAADSADEPGEKSVRAENVNSKGLTYILSFVLAALVVVFVYRLATKEREVDYSAMTEGELSAAWSSMVPSEMRVVARAAIDPKDPNKIAERIILRSAFSGDRGSDLVNYGLMRIAFDPRWEVKLDETDRRVVLTLALGRVLGDDIPQAKVDLRQLHPAVILAIAASFQNPPGIGQIPAAVLTQLPPPFSFAFAELLRSQPNLLCSSPAVQTLARFGTRGLGDAEEVVQFLREDTYLRLTALAKLFSLDQGLAKQLLDVLLNHPNIRLDHEIVRWGTAVKLINWRDLSSNDQLFILAGIPPSKEISVVSVVQLLAHPVARMRQYAIENVLNRIKLGHPGATAVLTELKANPDLLNAKQTLDLARFLERPETAPTESVRTWLETKPAPVLLEKLIVASADVPPPTAFDSDVSAYLQKNGWNPDVETLKKLAHHPERLTRFFAYTRIFALPDAKLKLQLLSDALAKEQVDEFRQQLEIMVTSLKIH